ILFNKLKSQSQNSGSQMLLAPITVTLGKEEYIAVTENLEAIASSGFDIEDFGNGTVIIRSCPMDLDNCEIAPLISEIAEYLIKNRRDINNEHLDWIYHNVACRSAIKAGDDNSEAELLALAKQVVNDNEVRFCPHGRPVMIELSKYELEKQFGRV
ncbi:MAG: DNA mismatch repair protein MutL, partial [Clostridia bacterium]|nr:DNA mismatch repair protein MutL [Clostridia bacterium]